MNNTFYIIAGIDEENKLYWLRNSNPMLWSDEISDCKKYLTPTDAKSDIHVDESTFRLIFGHSAMKKILLYEMNEDFNIIRSFLVIEKGNGNNDDKTKNLS